MALLDLDFGEQEQQEQVSAISIDSLPELDFEEEEEPLSPVQEAVDIGVRTPAALAWGMASWPFAQAAKFGAMYGQKGQQAIGAVPRMSDEEITELGNATADWFGTLGGKLTPKSKTGEKSVELAGKVVEPIAAAVHWLNSGIDQEKYPHAAQLADFAGEAMVFGFLHKAGAKAAEVGKKQLKARKTKKAEDIKAAREAEESLMKDVEEAAKKNEFDGYIEEYRNKIVEQAQKDRKNVVPVEQTTRSVLQEGREIAEAGQAEILGREPVAQGMNLRQQAGLEKGREGLVPEEISKSEASRRRAVEEGEVVKPELGKEPVSGLLDLEFEQPLKEPVKVEAVGKETIPRKEYQIDSETGKAELVSEVGERAEYQIKDGKPELVEKIPGKRTVKQISKETKSPEAVIEEFNEAYPGNKIKFDSIFEMPEIMKDRPNQVYFTPQEGGAKGATMALDVPEFTLESLKAKVDAKVKEFGKVPERSKVDVEAGTGKKILNTLLEPIKGEGGAVTLPTKEVKDFVKKAGKLGDEYLGAISTRLGNIDQSIKNKMRAFELDSNVRVESNIKKVLPFITKAKKMSKEDYKKFDTARRNSDTKVIDSLVKKYGLEAEYKAMRKVLDQTYKDATNAGYELRYRKDHFPREVTDYSGLIDHLYKDKSYSSVERMIKAKERKLKRPLNEAEKVKLINSVFRGYAEQRITLSQPGQLKQRRIHKLTPEMEKFYADSDSALLRYISDVSTAVEAKKLFGGKGKTKNIDFNETIGAYILKLYKEKKISPSQEIELRDILKARFDPKGTSGVVTTLKNLTLIDVMGSFKSAITQIGDLGWSLYSEGIKETTNALIPALKGKSKFTKEDLGISKIAAEFTDKSTSAKAVDKVFKATGLTKIDAIGKETLINATYNKAAKLTQQAKSHKGRVKLEKDLEKIFGKDAGKVLDDLANKRSTRDVKLYLLHKLADFQPAVLSELPAGFLKGGNWRVLYMLKSFGIKRLDVYRREVFQKIAKPGTRTEGVKNLVKLAAYLTAMEASADVIKDLMAGKEINISDTVIGNIGDLAISRFTRREIGKEGIGTGMKRQILPPTQFIDSVWKDVKTAGDKKGLETVKSIPLVGRAYYDWLGAGAKRKKKKGKGTNAIRTRAKRARRKRATR